MVLVYESSPGYYFLVSKDKEENPKGKTLKSKSKGKKGGKGKKVTEVKRISKNEFQKVVNKYNYSRDSIKVGDRVTVIIKPYKDGKHVIGKIKRILTKKKVHTRGHKVMLEDGTIGRMVSIGSRKK